MDNDPSLDETEIIFTDQFKFIRVIFDKKRKLTFISHLQYLKDKFYKALDPFLIIAHTIYIIGSKDW